MPPRNGDENVITRTLGSDAQRLRKKSGKRSDDRERKYNSIQRAEEDARKIEECLLLASKSVS